MSHIVKCPYCEQSFDRDKESYVQLSAKKYAHAICYAKERVKDPTLPKLEIYDLTQIVNCIYCKKSFNKSLIPCVMRGKHYAHLECADLEDLREKTPQEKLDEYICTLFNSSYVYPRIRKQINQFITEYSYSYSGIQKTLQYFYEIQHHDLDKAHDGIGIVPYVYKEAYNYFKTIYEANEKNSKKNINDYKPKEIEVVIPPPEVNDIKPKLFTFLDLDEVEDDE